MIVGIDIGASATKGVLLENLKIVDSCLVPTVDAEPSALKVLEHLVTHVGSGYKSMIEVVAVSGGGSRKIGKTLLDMPVKKVDEIKATGFGGLLLANKKNVLVISVGTGTAIVAAYDGGKKINHVGGTGVGGGTVLGLSKRMLGIDNFEVVERMASRGNANKVDLTVADIVGGPVGIVPAEATASNFGKLTDDADEEDVAAGIFNMVSQVVGVFAVMAAKAYNFEDDVILAGRLVKSKVIADIIHGTTEIFGVRVHIPENCEYCTAIGAAAYLSLFNESL